MKTLHKKINFTSEVQGDFVDITDDVREILKESCIKNGQVTIFVAHTTMSIAINHAEEMLLQDFRRMLYRYAPVDEQYTHDLFELRRGRTSDGRSNGHSHCKALIVGTSESVPVVEGRMLLSDIQSILAIDFDGPRSRDVDVHVIGE